MDGAFGRKHFAGEGYEGECAVIVTEFQRSGEIRDDEGFLKELLDDRGDLWLGLHPVERPCGGTGWEGLDLCAGGFRDEVFRKDGGLAEFLFREALDQGFGDVGVGNEDGLELRSEGGFDGAGGGVIGLDERGEHSVDGGLELVGRIEAFEEVLRAFGEAFAGGDELLHRIEAGGALGEDFVRFRGGVTGGIEIAAGVLISALGGLERFLQLGQLRAGFGDERSDVGLLRDVFLDT